MSRKIAWDVGIAATGTAMQRVMFALISVGGHFTDSVLVGARPIFLPSRTVRLMLRVFIPQGSESEFVRLARAGLSAPPQVQLGMSCGDEEGT